MIIKLYNNFINFICYYNNFVFQKRLNYFLAVPMMSLGITLRALNLTVLDKGLHCPAIKMSPSFILKHGDKWTEIFLCLFSNRLYFWT